MLTEQNTFSISDLRKNTLEVLEKVEEMDEPITIFLHSRPVAVMMSLKTYKKNQTRQSDLDHARYVKAMDFFIHPPKKFLIEKKGFDSVQAIRDLRD